MSDEYLSRPQLAALLHCCVRTIHNYEKSGMVPAPTVLGRKHLWLKSDLIAFIKSQREAQQAAEGAPQVQNGAAS